MKRVNYIFSGKVKDLILALNVFEYGIIVKGNTRMFDFEEILKFCKNYYKKCEE